MKHLRFNVVSKNFPGVIKKFITKKDKILEFGSSTGHVSYHLLKEGYNISLLDIRKEPIVFAEKKFTASGITTNFYHQDFFEHEKIYNFIWNSGYIQCCSDKEKEELIKHCASISNKLLLFWPNKSIEQRNEVEGIIKGFKDAKEYDTNNVFSIINQYYKKIIVGDIINVDTPYFFKWCYGENI